MHPKKNCCMTFWGGWKNSLIFLNNLTLDHKNMSVSCDDFDTSFKVFLVNLCSPNQNIALSLLSNFETKIPIQMIFKLCVEEEQCKCTIHPSLLLPKLLASFTILSHSKFVAFTASVQNKLGSF